MKRLKVTTKTGGEIATAFETVFKTVTPAEAAPVTQEQRLAPYRKEILRLRRRGLSWQQIATGMHHPLIGETVTARTLRQVFEPKADPAAVPASAPEAAPQAAG